MPPLEGAIYVNTTDPLRQHTTKGPGCRRAGVAMAYKLVHAVQARWRRPNGPAGIPLDIMQSRKL